MECMKKTFSTNGDSCVCVCVVVCWGEGDGWRGRGWEGLDNFICCTVLLPKGIRSKNSDLSYVSNVLFML